MIVLLIIGAVIVFFTLAMIEAQAEYSDRIARMNRQDKAILDTEERAKNKPIYKPYVRRD